MNRHLASQVKIYDPLVNRDIVPGQYHDFDAFLADIDFIVILTGHDQIIAEQDKLAGKVVFDTRHVLTLPDVYTL